MSAAERAQRDADKVFRWILIQSDKPRKAKVEAKAEAKPEAKADPRRDAKPEEKPVAPAAVRQARKTGESEASAAAEAAAPAPKSAPSEAVPAEDTRLATARMSAAEAAQRVATEEEEDDEEVALVPIEQVRPEFSGTVMRQLRKGLVQVRFDVRLDGTVERAEVVKSTNRRLNGTAVAAVSAWRFQPPNKPRTATVEVGFDLD